MRSGSGALSTRGTNLIEIQCTNWLFSLVYICYVGLSSQGRRNRGHGGGGGHAPNNVHKYPPPPKKKKKKKYFFLKKNQPMNHPRNFHFHAP